MEQLKLFAEEIIGDIYTYQNCERQFEIKEISEFVYTLINLETGEDHTVTDNVFLDLINIKTGKAKWQFHTKIF